MIIVFNVILHKHQSNHSAIKVPKTIYGIGSSRATNAILSIIGRSDLQSHSFNYKALSIGRSLTLNSSIQVRNFGSFIKKQECTALQIVGKKPTQLIVYRKPVTALVLVVTFPSNFNLFLVQLLIIISYFFNLFFLIYLLDLPICFNIMLLNFSLVYFIYRLFTQQNCKLIHLWYSLKYIDKITYELLYGLKALFYIIGVTIFIYSYIFLGVSIFDILYRMADNKLIFVSIISLFYRGFFKFGLFLGNRIYYWQIQLRHSLLYESIRMTYLNLLSYKINTFTIDLKKKIRFWVICYLFGVVLVFSSLFLCVHIL